MIARPLHGGLCFLRVIVFHDAKNLVELLQSFQQWRFVAFA